ncbi:hypothetical protein [Streptomyces sp. NBC_00503]|uniref:hypothetical protein n=1 Tax=Streptomyces sp. NBC_00503 TaxID=2903659 RepID=UPI002E80E781|nr:hypothetical protein [Streptomyces sp. NBC_00503]WUD84936.1 hypothetical protein OG490_32720 [Streptomyces sp. NBC_00503]
MQIIRAPRRTAAVVAGVVAVVLLVCGGLFTHPVHPMAEMAGMPAMTAVPAMDSAVSAAMDPAMDPAMDMGTGPTADKGADGGCSVSGEDCPLASAWTPADTAVPAGNLAGSAAWDPPPVAAGPAGPVPHRVCAQPRAPDLDSLCVSRT